MSQDPNIEKLRAARERLGYSQIELAKMIPLDRAYLSELENGRKKIQEWVMDKIEKIERERVENYDVRAQGRETGDVSLIVQALTAGQDRRSVMQAVKRLSGEEGLSHEARTLALDALNAKADELSGKKPIHGLSSELSVVQRGDAGRQRALAQRAAQGHGPSPKAGGPSGGKGSPGHGTAGRQKSRRSARGPVPV
jgi:transcriptional regulator with XRE-family HTH domain